MTQVWLIWRYFFSGNRFLNLSSFLCILGMSLGVACLVVTMAVVSGVQSLLKKAVVDVTGHIMLMRPSGIQDPEFEVGPKLKEILPTLEAYTPFVHLEAVAASNGKLSGVLLQGVDPDSVDKVLNLRSRIISGEYTYQDHDGMPQAMVGKELAKKVGIVVGSVFQAVIPRASSTSATAFAPKSKKYRVAGILDLGKFDFNERMILVTAKSSQELADVGNTYSGLRIKIRDPENARKESFKISSAFGSPFWTRDWFEVSRNFFSAIELEKIVIFIVMLSMIVVASFNVSSSLFVNVMRRYSDISVLRTLGATRSFIVRLFVTQGLLIGIIGSIIGLGLGVVSALIVAKSAWVYVPAEIYKFDHLPADFRWQDLGMIFTASLLICFISTIYPARRGAKLNPVEGLRYE